MGPPALRVDFEDRHDPARIGVRQWAQQHAIYNAEDCRGRADTKGKGKENDDGKAGIFSQHTKGEAQILKERFQKGQSAALAIKFFGLFDASEFDHRLATCFCGAHTGAQIVFDVHLEMAFHFVSEFALSPVFAKETSQTYEQRAQQLHADSFPGARKRARISVVCSHSRASLSSCLRPARVSL